MNKQTEALKLAMEALEKLPEMCGIEEAITAIREALAEQPAPGSHLTDEQKAANGLAWLARLEAMREEFAGLAEQPAQQQEPVAVTYKEVWGAMNALYAGDIKQVQIALEMENKKLYTSPPASKPWVELTDEEIESAMPGGIYDCLADPWDCNVGDGDYMRSIKKDVLRVARSAIAAYEEKNGITGEKA